MSKASEFFSVNVLELRLVPEVKLIFCKGGILVKMQLVGGTNFIAGEYSVVGFCGDFLKSLLVMLKFRLAYGAPHISKFTL